MIKFKTVFDANAVKQLNKHTIRKQLWIYLLLSAIMIVIGVADFMAGDGEMGVFCIVFGVLFTPILLLIVHFAQKNVDKSMTLFQGTTVEIYEFSEDALRIQTTKGEEYFSVATARYGYLYRVDETADSYFLYISKIQSHVVDKKYLIEGSIEELNELLIRKLGERFHAKKK